MVCLKVFQHLAEALKCVPTLKPVVSISHWNTCVFYTISSMTHISSEMERLYWSQKEDGDWNIFFLSGTCQYITVSQNPGENWWRQFLSSDYECSSQRLYMTNCTSVQVHVFQQQQPHTHTNLDTLMHQCPQTSKPPYVSQTSAPTAGLVSWRLAW